MLKIKSLTLALGAIAIAFTGMNATAGSWPSVPAKKVAQVSGNAPATTQVARQETIVARAPVSGDAFERVLNESGWQLREHQLALSGGTLVHSPQCVLAANAAAAPSMGMQSQPAGDLSPGA